MADEEDHLLKMQAIRRESLRIIEEQISTFGAFAPPYLLTERARLRQELGIVETVMAAPASAGVGDELGERGRFLYYHEQMRQMDKKIADLVGQVMMFIEISREWRGRMQRWLTWIVVAVFVLSLIAVAVVTYLATKGASLCPYPNLA